MFEVIVGGVLVVMFGGFGGLWLSDREGWSETMRRISSKGRARLEVSMGTRKKVAGKELVVRDRASEMGFKKLVPTHEIVRLDYYETIAYGLWPRWTCRCGKTDYYSTRSGQDMKPAQRKARLEAKKHVKMFTPRGRKRGSADFMF